MRKKIIRRLIGVIMVAMIMTATLTGCKKDEIEKTNYDILGIGELPIGLWVTPPAQYIDEENYRVMREAGINFINGFREETKDNIMHAMDLAKQFDIKFFVYQTKIEQNIKLYHQNKDKSLIEATMRDIKEYSSHPAYAGQLFIDEPGKPLFNAVNDFLQEYQELYPDKQWLVNMFPTYATGGIQTHSYDDYIDSWLDLVKPNYYSYDSYPLLTNGKEISDYFYNLDLVRKKTLDLQIPFWNFIQTLSIANTPGVPNKREPSEADIRWQVYVSLAFGSKGIQYFTYWSPGSGTETFGDALIDQQGNKTVRYEYVKNLNEEIYEIGKILVNLDALGVILTVDENDNKYKLYEEGKKSFGPITSVEGTSSVVGCFKDKEGNEKVLVTTYTPSKSSKVTLNIDSSVKRAYVWINGEKHLLNIKDNQINMNIEGGSGVFIEFVK